MSRYKGQITTVLHYINQKLKKDWTNEDSNAFNESVHRDVLAEKACMSIRNFQLYFKAYVGETYGAYISRVRLEYALQLLQEGNYTNAQIAERIGFANDTAFYNALKKNYDNTPSTYRLDYLEKKRDQKNVPLSCKIKTLSKQNVLFLSYVGNYEDFSSSIFEEDSWDKLYSFASSNKYLSKTPIYWGICYDNTEITDPNQCRFYACLSIETPIQVKVTDEIKCMTIPTSLYATFTYRGAYHGLNDFYMLALQNIPQGYQLSDEPILERYINSSSDVSIDQLITEVWIPIVKENLLIL